MSNNINLSDITLQIQKYVRLLKQKEVTDNSSNFNYKSKSTLIDNDLRSNINKLTGDNKFNIQTLNDNSHNTPPLEYASEAYNHLSNVDNKQKVVIGYMHKNNKTYDVKA